MRTYKSTRDLDDPYGTGTPVSKSKGGSGSSKGTRKGTNKADKQTGKYNGINSQQPTQNGIQKPPVNKFSNENGSYNASNDMPKSSTKINRLKGSGHGRPEDEVLGTVGRDGDGHLKRTIGNYDLDKMELLKTNVIKKASANVISRKKVATQIKEVDRKDVPEKPVSNLVGKVKGILVKSRRDGSRDRKSESRPVEKVQSESRKRQVTRETDVPRNSLEIDLRFAKDIYDEHPREKQTSPKFPKQTNRIFTGDTDFSSSSGRSASPLGSNFNVLNNPKVSYNQNRQNSLQSPDIQSPKPVPKCDPDVHLWLRRLGLLEEEKYVQIFAENEIDMEELILLSPEQLNKIGVVAVGAFNKLVRGIEELQQTQSQIDDDSVSFKSNKTWSYGQTATAVDPWALSDKDWDINQNSRSYSATKDWLLKSPRTTVGNGNGEFVSMNGQNFVSDRISSHSSEPAAFDKLLLFERELHSEKIKTVDERKENELKKVEVSGNTRTLRRSNSFSFKPDTSKQPLKAEHERMSRRDIADKERADKESQRQGKVQPRPRSRSLTRRGSVGKVEGKALASSLKTKQRAAMGNPPDLPKGGAVDSSVQQKAHAGNYQ